MRRAKIQRRLGYDLDAKLLIIHADDAGLCGSVNDAIFQSMKSGNVNSASLMVPCPKFDEAVAHARKNPQLDIGIHLTVTCEWSNIEWGPVLPREQVPSLVKNNGKFWGHDFYKEVNPAEVKLELIAQIDKVLATGLLPSHLDCHMNCLYFSPALFTVYVDLGKKYNLPIMVNKSYANHFGIDVDHYLDQDGVLANDIFMATPSNTAAGMTQYYENVLNDLKPGLNIILVHPGFDDDDLRELAGNVEPWGARWRQRDFDIFTGNKIQKIINEQDIKLVTWKEIQAKLS